MGWLLLAALVTGGCDSHQGPGIAAAPDSSDEAYANSVAALMWPGATRAYQVTAAGDLFNGAWRLSTLPESHGVLAGPPARITYEARWCPVARWSRTSGGVRWDFEAVAFPEAEPAPWSARGAFARMNAARARKADAAEEASRYTGMAPERLAQLMLRTPHPIERIAVDRRNLFVSWRVTATNVSAHATDASLVLRCDSLGWAGPYADHDTLVRTPFAACWLPGTSRDSVVGLISEGAANGRAWRRAWTLRPGERVTLDALLPAYPVRRAELLALARTPHAQRVAAARAFWSREVERGAVFDVPDPALANALRAARVVLLSLRERRDADWVPVGGPFHYRDVWVRDGARVAAALAVAGYTRESRDLASSFLRFRTPFGSFVSQVGQLDGTGQALWAFEQTQLRPSPSPDVKRFAAAGYDAWRAIEIQRGLTPANAVGIVPGMLPVTDPHDAELVRAQLVGNDAWSLAGYRAAERLLRAAADAPRAEQVARSRAEYTAAFRAALVRTGRDDVPPSWQGIGIDWGNLNVGWPCAALPPNDARLAALARRYWAPVGGPGLGYYRNPDSLHTYVAADLATVAMLTGDRATVDRILDATLHWRTASGGAAECFVGSTRDFGYNFPPHATSAAALLAMVRNALVFDDADTLALTLGARASWWAGTDVRRAPTRWGAIDLHFARANDVVTWHWSAVPVWTLLTLPPGTRAARVVAPLVAGPRPDQVLAPPGTTDARVALASGRAS